MSWLLMLCLTAVVVAGCDEAIEGPEPAVEDPVDGQPLPVDPGIVCQMQHPAEGTPIVVTGDGLTAVPFAIPDDPRVALPTLTLIGSRELDGAGRTPNEVVYSGLPDGLNASLLSWQSQQQMTFQLVDALTLDEAGATGNMPVGLYDLRATNANDNEDLALGTLAVVDRPRTQAITPGITCLAQGERTLDVTGTTILRIEGATADISVGDGLTVDVDGLSDCTTIAHPAISAETCNTATLTLAESAVEAGFPQITIGNPETAACTSVHDEDQINLRVVPAPEITGVVPPAVCTAEGPRSVTLEGTGFLEIDGVVPAVTLDGADITVLAMNGCQDLETQGHAVRTCTSVDVELPADMAQTEVLRPTVELTNPEPAGCSGSTSTGLVLVPPPTIERVEPPLICVEDGGRQVEVFGSGFIFVDGAAPTVTFDGGAAGAISQPAMGCEDLGVEGLLVERCPSILVDIPRDGLAAGLPQLVVGNPDPIGCSATADGVLTVVDGPELVSAAPPLVCTDDAERTLVLSGTGFLDVDGTWPEVTVDGTSVAVTSIDGCMPVMVAGLTVQQCDSLTITLARGSLMPGNPTIDIVNPAPAGCSTTSDTVLTVPPTLTLVSATPSSVCSTSATTTVDVTVAGTGFLRVDGVDFAVTVAGTPVTPTAVSGCAPLTVDGLTVESCDGFTVTIDTTNLASGPVDIAVTNPDPSGCATASSTIFELVDPPTVTAVAPTDLCADETETLTITGTNFGLTAQVVVTDVSTGMTYTADTVAVDTNGTEAMATFDIGLPAGTYDVTVDNGDSCSGTLAAAIEVDPTPIVYFVDPPVLYNGIATEVTIFTTGLDQTAASVEFVDSMGIATPAAGFASPTRPNRILAIAPSGLPADTYEVRITSAIGCVGGLPGAVEVVDTINLTLVDVDPAFASPTVATAVTVTADPATPFLPVPRVYLNPVTAGGTATATGLRAVEVNPADPTTLSAVVPGGLTPDTYDLIVVNPDGAVGLLSAAITVTGTEPPAVSSVAPGSFDAGATNAPATIFGENFDADPSMITVTLECENITTGMTSTGTATVDVANATSTELPVLINGSSQVAGDVCLVVVTHGDGAAFRYSAISFKEPAQNLQPWTLATDMLEARRALVLSAGRPTATSRFLYAVGGDDGALANAKTSVESVDVGVFGDMGTWTPQRNDLSSVWDGTGFVSAPRTFAAGTTVGNFVYVVGGNDGTAPVDTTLRAQILDPLAGPEIVDLDAVLGDGTIGLEGGFWNYRVAAVFPASDPSNPGGESLPGETLPVQLPALTEKLVLTLNWAPVPGASGYRIYRSPMVDDPVTSVELLAELTCAGATCDCTANPDECVFVDDGSLATDSSVTPMPQGSLGVWHTVAPLMMPREALGISVVADPMMSGQWWLYAVGGRDAMAPHDTLVVSTLTVAPDGGQTMSAWQPVTATLGAARAELDAFVVTGNDTNVIADGAAWLYVGQGRGASGNVSLFEAGRVVLGDDPMTLPVEVAGDIVSLTGVTAPSPVRVGYVGLAANGWLFTFGGANRSASNNDTSNQVESPAPTLGNWDALGGGGMIVPRIYADGTEESAFFFVAGGATDLSAATTSVEQTVQ